MTHFKLSFKIGDRTPDIRSICIRRKLHYQCCVFLFFSPFISCKCYCGLYGTITCTRSSKEIPQYSTQTSKWSVSGLFVTVLCVCTMCGSEVAHCISYRERVRKERRFEGLEGEGDMEGMTVGGKL